MLGANQMTSDEFDKAIINGAMQLMRENEKKFFTLLAAEDRILAKEFEGEMWIKATDHSKEVERAVAAERERIAKQFDSGLVNIRARGQE